MNGGKQLRAPPGKIEKRSTTNRPASSVARRKRGGASGKPLLRPPAAGTAELIGRTLWSCGRCLGSLEFLRVTFTYLKKKFCVQSKVTRQATERLPWHSTTDRVI